MPSAGFARAAVLCSGAALVFSACHSAPAPAPTPATDPAPAGFAPPAGFIVVANQQSASASLIELPSGKVTALPVGVGPHEAAISGDRRRAVVTVYGEKTPGSQLAVIDLGTGAVTRTIELGEFRRPHGVVALPGAADRLVVTSEASRRLLIVNIADGRVEADIPTNARGSHMVAVTADGRRAFTANVPDGSISEIDLEAKAFVRTVPISTVTEGVAVTPDGREVWVGSNDKGTVTVFDTRADSIVATLTGFQTPYRIGISPDGRRAVVCDPPANLIHVVDVKTRRVLGTVGGLGSPRGATVAADNRTAFVTLGDEGAVAVVDLDERTVLRRHPVGASPDGVAFTGPR
jgi:YVTN family beta-propeller protein